MARDLHSCLPATLSTEIMMGGGLATEARNSSSSPSIVEQNLSVAAQAPGLSQTDWVNWKPASMPFCQTHVAAQLAQPASSTTTCSGNAVSVAELTSTPSSLNAVITQLAAAPSHMMRAEEITGRDRDREPGLEIVSPLWLRILFSPLTTNLHVRVNHIGRGFCLS